MEIFTDICYTERNEKYKCRYFELTRDTRLAATYFKVLTLPKFTRYKSYYNLIYKLGW